MKFKADWPYADAEEAARTSRHMAAPRPAYRLNVIALGAQVLSRRSARTHLAQCATVDHQKAHLADE